MRILRLIPSVDPTTGGPAEGIRQVQAPLTALGHDIEVACCDSPSDSWLLADRSLPVVHALGPSRLGYRYAPRLAAWLNANIERFDVVIVHGLWQYPGFIGSRIARAKAVPYVVFAHGMLDPWFRHAYPAKHFKKIMYWYLVERWVLKSAEAVIFTSEEEKVRARKSFPQYDVKELVTSYGTTKPLADNEECKRRFLSNFPLAQGKRLILFLGRLHEKKGCDLLLRAFAATRSTAEVLVMAGPGEEQATADLKRLAEDLEIAEQVIWPGLLRGELKWGAYASCEVFCLPSHQENFGISVAEALAFGRPVLLSDKVNIWREVVSARAGFVDEDTYEGTVRNIERWKNLSASAYEVMSGNAFDCFTQNFEIKAVAARIDAILRTVVGGE